MTSSGAAEDALVAAVRDLMVATDGLRSAAARHHGLNTSDVTALSRLAARGPLTASDLAATLHLTGASVTAVADRLEQRGLARRVPHPSDRRRVVVEITDLGRSHIVLSRTLIAEALGDVPDPAAVAGIVADVARRLAVVEAVAEERLAAGSD